MTDWTCCAPIPQRALTGKRRKSRPGPRTRQAARQLRLGLAWLGLAWLGLAWLGLAWLGLAWQDAGRHLRHVKCLVEDFLKSPMRIGFCHRASATKCLFCCASGRVAARQQVLIGHQFTMFMLAPCAYPAWATGRFSLKVCGGSGGCD